MIHASRMAQYRRRRRREANRRRGVFLDSTPAACGGGGSRFRPLMISNGCHGGDLVQGLRDLGRKASGYAGIDGALFRQAGDRVDIVLVVRRPLLAPVRLLGRCWLDQLRDHHPGCSWSLSVHDAPPEDDDDTTCLFWSVS